jgi:hypothetical protein
MTPRRVRTGNQATDFTVHLQLARRQALNRRLNTAALLLVVAALLTWAVNLGFTLQLAGILAAGITGFLWPVRGAQEWSRNWIRSHAGLAYETALQLEDQPRDGFGLRVAVRSHARTAMARMERPQYQNWWTIGVVLTALILLLPVVQLRAPWSAPGSPPGAAGPASPAAAEDPQDSGEAASARETVPEGQLQPEPAAPAADGAGAAPDGVAQPGDGSDSSVLDRFLDNLRQRPPETAGQEEPGAAGDGRPLGAQADAEPGEAESGSPAAAREEDSGQPESSAEGPARPENGPANDGLSPPDPGGDEPGEAGEQTGLAESPEAGEAAGEQPGQNAPLTRPDPDPAGATPAEGDEGDGDGAGGTAGSETDASPASRLPAAGEAEFLEGDLAGAAANPAGSVRLPPFTDVELPPDSGQAASFTRAAERAVTEGQVPLEYQQIIRNYFRP